MKKSSLFWNCCWRKKRKKFANGCWFLVYVFFLFVV